MLRRLLFRCSEPSSVQGRVQKYLAQVPVPKKYLVIHCEMIVIDHDVERGDFGTCMDLRYLLFGS